MKSRKSCLHDQGHVWLDRVIFILLVFVLLLALAFPLIAAPDPKLQLRESHFVVSQRGNETPLQ